MGIGDWAQSPIPMAKNFLIYIFKQIKLKISLYLFDKLIY